MPWFVHDDHSAHNFPVSFLDFSSEKGNKYQSTESVTLDRHAGGCYIRGVNQMMRALQGKLWGALFFRVFAFLLCSGCSVWPGLGPRASLIPPLFKELQKRGFHALFEPLAEFWIVLLGDLDGDCFLIDSQRAQRTAVLIFDDRCQTTIRRLLVVTCFARASRVDRLELFGTWSVIGQGGRLLLSRCPPYLPSPIRQPDHPTAVVRCHVLAQ